ncbi:MAG: hypothetical protein AMXMBFR84_24310 [Candidatus Hydrogenedentota bacterium]
MCRCVRILTILTMPVLVGFTIPDCSGGFQRKDFVKINVNGFDPADNDADHNDYAWAMEHYTAPGSDTGYLYVGTGNNIANLILYNFGVILYGLDLNDAPIHPPEIRRYRPDLGETHWERVFDYKDADPEGTSQTIGFRMMRRFTPATKNGVAQSYLYAAAMGRNPTLWRSVSGDPGTWQSVWSSGGPSIRWMAEHNGALYVALTNDALGDPLPGQIWKSIDGSNFVQVIGDGFGNPANRGCESLISFNGYLYVGTANYETGFEIWRCEGPDKAAPVRIMNNGGPDMRNDIAGSPCIFNGHLYFGSIIFFGFNPQRRTGFKGSDIVRIYPDDSWETVVGPESVSGYDSGFNHFTNAYLWWMETHDGWLYAGTWDQASLLALLIQNFPVLQQALSGAPLEDLDVPSADETDMSPSILTHLMHAGFDLFKTNDGVHWIPVSIDGFGNPGNYGIRTMKSVGDSLYVGTANPFQGVEVWKATSGE